MDFWFGKKNPDMKIVLSGDEWPGVKRIAGIVSEDIDLVTGVKPEVVIEDSSDMIPGNIYVATLGHSKAADTLLAALTDHGMDISAEPASADILSIRSKRESYCFYVTPEGALVITGSDKRGTIYGLFHISEIMGVSPWVWFADVHPAQRDSVRIDADTFFISKEPSVEYRGIFINDEWPSFGSWTFEHFGGFTSEMYEHVFELILRLKGNYLWPAMWTSNFSLDGPGLKNAELADEMGIVMSNSHHEPCLRHSEEWDLVKGQDTPYGTEWNFDKNKEGLTNYWRDGLIRNGGFENIITMGMRGERDSEIMGAEATLKDNIDYIKEVVEVQNRLIRETIDRDLSKVPRMIAIYKEVEKYYYGDGENPGLRTWDGLDGITCMLCEDNHGNMRGLPSEEERDRDGGFGMYYHFDYHGGPVSYEWINSTSLSKTWEQMCEAYEAGVRKIWIVNTGDLKPQELPISFFMDLAYDYEKWGISNTGSASEYLRKWVNDQFGQRNSDDEISQTGTGDTEEEMRRIDGICEIIDGYTYLNQCRRPETLNADTYHPFNYGESDAMLKKAAGLYRKADELAAYYKETPLYDAYEELAGFPARASANLLYMQICAGRNKALADMGCPSANVYAGFVDECFKNDLRLRDMYHSLAGGKWNGIMLSEHIGFRNWNEEEAAYPVRTYVYPSRKSRMTVRLTEKEKYTCGGDWTGQQLTAMAFLDLSKDHFSVTIENSGSGDLKWNASSDSSRIRLFASEGVIKAAPEQAFPGQTEPAKSSLRPGEENGILHMLSPDPSRDISNVYELIVSIDRNSAEPAADNSVSAGTVTIETGFSKVRIFIPFRLSSSVMPDEDRGKNRIHHIPVVPEALLCSCSGRVPDEFIRNDLGLVIDAGDYNEMNETGKGRYETISPYGKFGTGVKAYPVTRHFEKDDAPSLTYNVVADEAGDYDVTVVTAPSNPTDGSGQLRIGIGTGDKENASVISMVGSGYTGGENSCREWCVSVLDQEHKKTVTLPLDKGLNKLIVYAVDPGVVLERILIRKSNTSWEKGYMGVIGDGNE